MSLNKKLIAGGAPDVGYQGAAFNYVGGENISDTTVSTGFAADLAFIIPTGGVSGPAGFDAFVIDKDIVGPKNWINQSSNWYKSSLNCVTWNDDNFVIDANSDTRNFINTDRDFTGMAFKTSDTGVSNTDGSITSTVYANPDFGVSKIKFTGTGSAGTIGHGLGTTPELVFTFRLDSYSSGTGYKTCDPATYRYHNEGSSPYPKWRKGEALSRIMVGPHNDPGTFTANSTTITLDNNTAGGNSSSVFLFIAFASASGFSKYASYAGNGSTSTRTILSADFDPSSIFIMGNNNNLWLDESFRTSGTDLPRWDSGDITNVYQQENDFNLGTGEYIRADWRTNKRVLLNTDSFSCNTNGDKNGVIAFGGDNWNPVP